MRRWPSQVERLNLEQKKAGSGKSQEVGSDNSEEQVSAKLGKDNIELADKQEFKRRCPTDRRLFSGSLDNLK